MYDEQEKDAVFRSSMKKGGAMNEFNQSLRWMTKDPFGQAGYAFKDVPPDMGSPAVHGGTMGQTVGTQGIGQGLTGGMGSTMGGAGGFGATGGGFGGAGGGFGGKENKKPPIN